MTHIHNRRRAVTLVEVLIAIFLMGIGLMAILSLFPLGAAQMAQALKDQRAAEAATNAAAMARVIWKDACNTDPNSGPQKFLNDERTAPQRVRPGDGQPEHGRAKRQRDCRRYRNDANADRRRLSGVCGPDRLASQLRDGRPPLVATWPADGSGLPIMRIPRRILAVRTSATTWQSDVTAMGTAAACSSSSA